MARDTRATALPSVITTGAYVTPQRELNLTASTGTHTIAIRLARNNGTGTMQARFFLAVYDAGPVTPASIAPPVAGPRVVASGNALGIIAFGAVLGSVTVATTSTQVMPVPVSVFLATGRRYRLAFACRAFGAGDGIVAKQTVALYDNGASNRAVRQLVCDLDNPGSCYIQTIIDGDGLRSTATTCGGTEQRLPTPCTADQTPGFWVEDVGPTPTRRSRYRCQHHRGRRSPASQQRVEQLRMAGTFRCHRKIR
jgi:hypothetical protein